MTGRSPKLSEVAVGDELPPLAIPLTTSLIVGGALASRDFTPVHHDRAAAQAVGMPDVFMNILTSNGLLCRYVTDWAGPNAEIRGLRIRLGTPNHPGDTMKLVGRVAAKEGNELVLEVVGKNAWGNHLTATVRVAMPR
jgi:acyl dehydratase